MSYYNFRFNIFGSIILEYDINGTLCQKPDSEWSSQWSKPCTEEEVEHKISQTLWPDHCVMDTEGASLAEDLIVKDSDIYIKCGFRCEVHA